MIKPHEPVSFPPGDASEPESGPVLKLAASIDRLARVGEAILEVIGSAELDAGANTVRFPFAEALLEFSRAIQSYVQLERDKLGPSEMP